MSGQWLCLFLTRAVDSKWKVGTTSKVTGATKPITPPRH